MTPLGVAEADTAADETADAFLARYRYDLAGAQRELRRTKAERHRRLILAGQGLLAEEINYWPQVDEATVDRGKSAGRPEGSEVPILEGTVLEVLRLVVQEDASARAIAKATDERHELSFECEDLDEALEVAGKHPVASFGTLELRPFAES
jgi:hypothetical protein